jgi:hypothetical protein
MPKTWGNHQAVRIRETHWAILVQGWPTWHSGVIAATNAITDRAALINAHSLLVRLLGGRHGDHATTFGVLANAESGSSGSTVGKMVCPGWYLRLS